MVAIESVKANLSGLSAELIATEYSDKEALRNITFSLEKITQLLEEESDAVEFPALKKSLGTAREILDAVVGDRLLDPETAIDAITGAIAIAAEDLNGKRESNKLVLTQKCLEALCNTALSPAEIQSSTGDTEQLCVVLEDITENVKCAQEQKETINAQVDMQWILPLATDTELLEEFVIESLDRISLAEGAILELESNPNDQEHINEIFRGFHTIKGTSGFLELDAIQRLAHLAENLLDRAREGTIHIVGGYADLSFRSCDMLRKMLSQFGGIKPGDPIPKPPAYDELINHLSDPEDAGFGGDTAVPVTQDSDTSENSSAEEVKTSQQATSRCEGDSSIRVSIARLDSLIDMAGELVIAHSMVAEDRAVTDGSNLRLIKNVGHSGKIIRDLQDLAMALRMVPLKSTFQKMARMVRDLGRKSGKSVQFVMEGEDTEIDRNMVEALADPLVHMMRNSMDHGIEDTEIRTANGKSPTGTVSLRAYHSAGNVVIELVDDGQGLDRDAIVAKAVERGVVEAGRELSDREAFNLIFHAGLSTAKQVTNISGRGVGMDVVRQGIESLNGRIELSSTLGKGTTCTLHLPLTMAISDAMLLGIGKEKFLMPIPFIVNSFRPKRELLSSVKGRGEVVPYQGRLLPLFRLHELFGIEGAQKDPCEGLIVVIEAEGKSCALLVDAILGQNQVVIKSLGPLFGSIDGVSGGAILGDGNIGLILDASGILKLALV